MPDVPHSRSSRFARIAVDHPVALFVAFAYAFSWSLFLPMIVAGAIIVPLIVAASFGPSMAAVVTFRLATGKFQSFRFASSWPRAILGAVAGFALVVMAYVVIPAIIVADPYRLRWSVLISVGVYNASTLLGGPLGEEPGWRGYALPRLEQRYGPVRGSLLLALIWVGWHLPLFLVPHWTSSPVWEYALMLCGLSLIMTFAFNLAESSIIAAVATHAAFNTVSRFLTGIFEGVEPRIQMSLVTVMALSGLVIGTILIATTKGRLAYRKGTVDLKANTPLKASVS